MEFKLDNSIYKLAQLRRISFELNQLILKIEQNRIIDPNYQIAQNSLGVEVVKLIELNNIDINSISDLKRLESSLEQIGQHPALIHFSFNQEADSQVLQKLVAYIRENIYPNVLISVGLDPSITIGCRIRLTNKSFDFSLRSRLNKNKDLLLDKIRTFEG
jgi:hypothetical protein